ncbi:MAG TPA: tetratricopeptide repeat protein [Candidatus Acidoferrum sp.]|nr:tetratricopeptide repeat protein [Candidatus Acidoferrum sp.]
MKTCRRLSSSFIMIAGLLLCWNGIAAAQGGSAGAAAGASATANAANLRNKGIGRDTSPLNPENSLELIKPAEHREEEAYRSFQAVSPEDPKKKVDLGEAFLKKYPVSQYRPRVYSALVAAYLDTNQVQKMEETGDKELALNPNDVQVLAMLGQTIPRTIAASTPEPEKRLDKAQQYSTRAIEGTLAFKKPEGFSDDEFQRAKSQTLAIAHSGLGLVYFHRGKLAEAIAELEQSVKMDPRADPTNYYVLGVAQHNSMHYREAAAAFSKCAEFQGNLQATCKEGAEKDTIAAAAQ